MPLIEIAKKYELHAGLTAPRNALTTQTEQFLDSDLSLELADGEYVLSLFPLLSMITILCSVCLPCPHSPLKIY